MRIRARIIICGLATTFATVCYLGVLITREDVNDINRDAEEQVTQLKLFPISKYDGKPLLHDSNNKHHNDLVQDHEFHKGLVDSMQDNALHDGLTDKQQRRNLPVHSENKVNSTDKDSIHVAIASCLSGAEYRNYARQWALTRTCLTSLLTFNPRNIHMHVFVLPGNGTELILQLLESYAANNSTDFRYTLYNASMPHMGNIVVKDGPIATKNVTLETLFKPCSAQRLFLPTSLSQLEKILYMDTDTLVLGSLRELWASFKQWNSSQIYAMAYIAKHRGFYDARPFKMPYKGLTGHNAGVMLMHLERMRRIGWQSVAMEIIRNLSGPQWAFAGDQDVLNYYNGLYPDNMHELACNYNWRWSYCQPSEGLPQECSEAHTEGAVIVHGVSASFFKRGYFTTRLFRIFSTYQFGTSINEFLIEPVKAALVQYKGYVCGSLGAVYYRKMEEYVMNQG